MRIFLIALLASLIISSNVRADPLKDLSWVGPQIMSAINKHNVWTPTDFAIARGDSVSSIPKVKVARDVLQKSGITLPDILETILTVSYTHLTLPTKA